MYFDGSGTDAEFFGDVLVLTALLDEFENLLLARGQLAAGIAVGTGGVAENAVFHPASAGSDGSQTGENGGQRRGFAENSAGTGLEEAESFGFGDGDAPDNDRGSGAFVAGGREPVQDGLDPEGF